MYEDIGRSLSTDYFLIADQLTEEELGYLRRTRDFVDNEVLRSSTGTGSARSSRGRWWRGSASWGSSATASRVTAARR
jgi:hypothetical protein